MNPHRTLLRSVLALGALVLGACSSSTTGGADCTTGEIVECDCSDGSTGESICDGAVFGVCVCGDAGGETGVDSGEGDLGGIDAVDRDALGDTGDPDAGEEDLVPQCPPQNWWPDADLDGQGARYADPVFVCEEDAPAGYVDNQGDCNDDDAYVYTGAAELCDGADNDCDGQVDENIQYIPFWVDADGDGFGDPESESVTSCSPLDGFAPNRTDCDDTSDTVFPRAEDLCDGIDNNCDLRIDDDAEFFLTWPDNDEDLYGDADNDGALRCELIEGWVDNSDDCNDFDPNSNPEGVEVCDLRDNNCDGVVDEGTGVLILYLDLDEDGWGASAARPRAACEPIDGYVGVRGDCDDTNEGVFPGAVETCNGVDDDCDGVADNLISAPLTFWADQDRDGFGDSARIANGCAAPTGYVGNPNDCDDTRSDVYPEAAESCDGVDNNCDTVTDEGLRNACGDCGTIPNEICNDRLDNNCDGTIDESGAGCFCDGRTNQPCYSGPPETLGIGICRGGSADCNCPGGARFCTDGSWGVCASEVLPQTEVCDGLDNNCDGQTDEGLRNRCGACGPEPLEICDGLDNNCDGVVDEGVRLACGLCAADAVGLTETCGDGLDNNCDGRVDEDCVCAVAGESCYPGAPETLNVGLCRAGALTCYEGGTSDGVCLDPVLPALEVCDGDDNDCDGRVDVSASGCSVCDRAAETCDGVDNNCDGQIDEGLRNACGVCLSAVAPEETGGAAFCDGLDNDCDGQIDEGLLNACGLCNASCYVDGWSGDAAFALGELDGTVPASGLRLNTDTFTYADVWIANSGAGTVTRINSATGAVIGTYPTNGTSPSRTAVDLDGNAWVANRAFGAQGSVTKIRGNECTTGCNLFTVNVGGNDGLPRALAIDAENHAWVGNFNERRIYRLRPSDGAIVNQYDIPIRPYGFSIDRNGILWVASVSDGVGAFDINTRTWRGNWTIPGCSGGDTQAYGIAVDGAGNVWMGSWNCDRLVRLNRSEFDAGRTPTFNTWLGVGMDNTRGVAVDGDGIVWVVASFNNRLYSFDPASGTFLGSYETCAQPTGVGVAPDGTIWVGCYDSAGANHHRRDGSIIGFTTTGSGPYSYSDLTGFQLRNFTAPRGYWRQTYDCGFTNCTFDSVRWTASEPAGTDVSGRFQSSVDGVTWTPYTSYYTTSPAVLSLPTGRYLRVEMQMTTTVNELSPVLTNIEIDWQRP
jgi:streptogramin lyase